jgi:hypothetical protein
MYLLQINYNQVNAKFGLINGFIFCRVFANIHTYVVIF